MADPTTPSAYSWEATDEQVSARYGVPLEQIARFDLNTTVAPPEFALELLTTGAYGRAISEYPPSDYRALAVAAAEAYGVEPDEILVGAGADEILDLLAKAFLPPGAGAVVPVPTYAMYSVLTEQRPARVLRVPRMPATNGYALDLPATRAAASEAAVVWLCSPNNPTALAEPAGTVAALLADLAGDAAADGRTPPLVVIDEAYAEFAGETLLPLRHAYPRLVVVRTASKAYALAGLRVGFAIARPEIIAEVAPYRPPGSVSIPSVAVVTAALRRPDALAANIARITAERARLAEGFGAAGFPTGPSVTNFLLVNFGSPTRAGAVADALLRRGLVPRTFGAGHPFAGHPLAGHLRFTVRSTDQNDRLLAAIGEIAAAGAPASTESPA